MGWLVRSAGLESLVGESWASGWDVEWWREGGHADPGPGPGIVHMAFSLAEESVGTCPGDGGQL